MGTFLAVWLYSRVNLLKPTIIEAELCFSMESIVKLRAVIISRGITQTSSIMLSKESDCYY